jgi:hypothetical protein
MKQIYLTKKINEIVSTILILLGLKKESIGLSTTRTSKPLINFDSRNSFGLYSFKAALVFLLFASMGAKAQIGVTITGNTNTTPNLAASYTTLASALTALNATTAMTGPVTLTLTAGTSETAPATGLVIGSASLNAVVSATKTVTIVKAGGTVTLNAGVGTSSPTASNTEGILKLAGADWITIDGLTLTDGNATTPGTMEVGIGMYKLSATDGCNNNTIQNCTINMQRINNTSGTPPVSDGTTDAWYLSWWSVKGNDSTATLAQVNWVNLFPALGTTPDARLNNGSAAATGASFIADKFFSVVRPTVANTSMIYCQNETAMALTATPAKGRMVRPLSISLRFIVNVVISKYI